jgi:hypothetical protein
VTKFHRKDKKINFLVHSRIQCPVLFFN